MRRSSLVRSGQDGCPTLRGPPRALPRLHGRTVLRSTVRPDFRR